MSKFKHIKIEDSSTPTQVASVSSSGALKVDNSGVTQPITASTLPLPSGAATSANQSSEIELVQTLNSLIETLYELINRLAPLAGAMTTTASLRITGISMPSTAVTGPITSAQSIAEKVLAGVSYTQRLAIENQQATLANINNTTA